MRAIYVPISPEDLEALHRAAAEDRRRPRDQAAVLLLEALRRRTARADRSARKPEGTAA